MHGYPTLDCLLPAPDTGTWIYLTCSNIGHNPHAGVTLVTASPADNVGDPHGSPRHRVLGGPNLLVITVQEAGWSSFAITNLLFFVLKKSEKKKKRVQGHSPWHF